MPQSNYRTDWLCIATSGQAVDGRAIEPQWLIDAAETYTRKTYTAMIWPHHPQFDIGEREFTCNLGEVDALKVETEGDVTKLYAQLIPNQFLIDANRMGQKLFTSAEFVTDFAGSGREYLFGLAVTDIPASLGTEKLKFVLAGEEKDAERGNLETFSLGKLKTSQPEKKEPSFWGKLFSTRKEFTPAPESTTDKPGEGEDKKMDELKALLEQLLQQLKDGKAAAEGNADSVVYSVTIGADVGDFDFNWVGLINKASGTLAMIIHAPDQRKVKNANGQQGNVLVRSMLMEYNGAQNATAIITPAETWQIDFTARLSGMDEADRLAALDIYGTAAFFDDGFKVAKTGSQYYVTHGLGYVGGLRATLAADYDITVTTLPIRVWLDVSWTGTLTSVWGVQSKITVAEDLTDYEETGVKHYVFALASIDSLGNITDLRPKGNLSDQQAINLYLRIDQNLADVPDKDAVRDNLGMGISSGDVYPVGAPIPWPTDTPPENHAFLHGQTFDVTAYPITAKAYPGGVLPDMREMTIKGKPDGRAVLGYESDGIKRHSHTATVEETDQGEVDTSAFDYGTKTTAAGGDHTHTQIVTTNRTGTRLESSGGAASYYIGQQQTGAAGAFALELELGPHGHKVALGPHSHKVVIDESGNDRTTVENIAFNYIVRLA